MNFDNFLRGFKVEKPEPRKDMSIEHFMQRLAHQWMRENKADKEFDHTFLSSRKQRCRVTFKVEIL